MRRWIIDLDTALIRSWCIFLEFIVESGRSGERKTSYHGNSGTSSGTRTMIPTRVSAQIPMPTLV
jgi:hypothetical protein